MDGEESGQLAGPLASPRRRLWLALGVGLLIVRIALPFVLRPLLVARADEALVGHIELEDLDLSLLRGGVTLKGLSVHTDEPPSQAPPLFEARRLWTQISWLALLTRTLEIEELELEGFHVRLDRFADGLALPKLVAASAADGADATAENEADEDSDDDGWSLAADAVVLRDGRIELRDHTVEGPPETFALDVEDFTARELAIRTDPADGEPGRVAIEAKLDQGSLSLAAWIEQSATGLDVKTNLVLHDLPIDRLRAYLPMFAWSALSGRLDADLEHHFVSGGAHELKGKACLAALAIGVAGLDEPALSWERFEVVVDRVDLVQHRIELAEVTSTGARLIALPRAADPLPLLAPPRPSGPSPSGPSAPVDPAADDAKPKARDGSEEDGAWRWRIARARIDDATIEVRGGETPVELGVLAEIAGLASEAGTRAPIDLRVTAPRGSLALAGEVSPSPVAFAGRLTIRDLALPALLAPLEAPAVHWLRSGSLRSDLRVALARDLRVAGTVGLADLELEEASTAKQFAVDWKDLEVAVASLVLPDVLGAGEGAGARTSTADEADEALAGAEQAADPDAPTTPAAPAPPAARTLSVSLARLALLEPRFRLTRDAKGIVLPSLEPVAKAEASEATGAAPAPTAPEATPSPPTPKSAQASTKAPPKASPLAVQLAIADLRIAGGRGKLADRAVEPYYRGRIETLDVEAQGVRWPAGEIDALALTMTGLNGAKLDLKGALSKDGSTLEGELVELPLEQFNPYLTSSGYSLRKGALSLRSKGRFEAERFKTRSRVVVSALDLGGSQAESLFQESFGIPLSVALGLLTDLDGKITLAVPVAGRRDKVELGFARLVGQALRKALVGALASPLKLLGAVAKNGKVEKLAPDPIAFDAGAIALSAEGTERVEELAGLLAASPGLQLVLSGRTSAADERRLREADLLRELESQRGVRALSALGELGTRRAVRAHLASRSSGAAAPPLTAEQARWLESQVEHRALAPGALAALASARAEAVRALLTSDHGIAASRVALGPPDGPPDDPASGSSSAAEPDGIAGVAIGLGAVAKVTPPSGSP